VNVVDCESTYRWEGEVHADEEAILFAKTTDEACEALMARVEDVHPYDVPAIERFEESRINGPFARWRADAVG
jgi:periplasmic divalent cation tolerance protein